ncbi:MAG TPA: hypothetical protein VFS39_02765 [Nitrospira sp.]|nr:hypothetical protein [Nitrospira sp.]
MKRLLNWSLACMEKDLEGSHAEYLSLLEDVLDIPPGAHPEFEETTVEDNVLTHGAVSGDALVRPPLRPRAGSHA